MPTTETPSSQDLPSSRTLLRSTIIALAVAAALLVTVVLPAEYGVDATGIGRVLGLTEMGQIKRTLALEAAAEDRALAEEDAAAEAAANASAPVAATPASGDAGTPLTHATELSLAPNEGKEIKLVMAKGATATFHWSASGGVVNYDMHGDSTNAPNSYHGYAKANGVRADSGSLTAAFDGSHGWFWRNRSGAPVTITLRTSGAYTELKKLY